MKAFYRLGSTVDAADFFCGGGGASQGVLSAGVDLQFAANHDAVAIATHAANHPHVDHHQVDLLEYDVGKFPAVRMAHFSPSCKHHSQANAHKMYEQPGVLREFIAGADGHEEVRSGYANSERSRVTMSCVLRYAAVRRPETMIVENVVEAAKWGPDRDGSTFRWWLAELDRLGYETHCTFLNSVAFGVPQSRDRMFVVCWLKGMRRPDLEHWATGWCSDCERRVDARQVFRKPTKAWPMERWGKLGKQYDYRCGECDAVVDLDHVPVAAVLDFTDLGQRIGDRAKPLAASTVGRIERYLSMHEHRLPIVDLAISHAAQVTVYGNTMERPGSTCRGRSVMEPTWAQHTTEAYGVAFRGGTYEYQNRTVSGFDEVAPTATCRETMALVGSVVPFRKHTASTGLHEPIHTQTSEQRPGMAIYAAFAKNNGGPADTCYHPTSDPAGTQTAKYSTSLASVVEDGPVDIDDVRFRMFKVDEIRGIMAYDKDFIFAAPDGGEPNQTDKIRLLGDGVTPPVLEWLTSRTLEIMS